MVNTDPHSAFDQAFLRESKREVADSDIPVVRGVDLFCGCGGLSLGADEACRALGRRFESALAIDNEMTSLFVYEKNFGPLRSMNCNIEDVVDGKLGGRSTATERRLFERAGDVDLLLAGPPCQGHSDLNNHTRRNDRRNALYERVGRFAELVTPEHILIENVPTVVHGRDGALDRTADALVKIGYHIDAGIVDLSDLGVPQRRRRHVLVASMSKPVSIKETIQTHRVGQPRNVAWAIRDLEGKEAISVVDRSSHHSPENDERIAFLFRNRLFDLPNERRPRCHRNGHHSYKSMYGRLRYDQPAQTITSGFGSPGQGRFIHPNQPRTLTPHEAARLQFFPDFFDFSRVTKRTALANMIGNAVPMKLSYAFVMELII